MKGVTFLEKKLEQIAVILRNRYKSIDNVGVMTGVSGIALFQFYYSKYLNRNEYAELGSEMIFHSFEMIDNGYTYPSYCDGIAGLCWTIQHLESANLVDLDGDVVLSQFDEYLYNQMKFDLKVGTYDFLHGALGYAYYFLNRYEHTKDMNLKRRYQTYLMEAIAQLEDHAIIKEGTIKWESTLNSKKGNRGIDLGLSHGIASIINFLSRAYKFTIFKKMVYKLLMGSTNYLLSLENKNAENLSLYPVSIEKDRPLRYNGRISWCYGDLGIGLSLTRAGIALNNVSIQRRALDILKHTTSRKGTNETLVKDAGICHGSYGNALIYGRISQMFHRKSFQKATQFWIGDGIQKAIHKDGYAGYKQWDNGQKKWTSELSLLEGISGIGLVIIDYLSKTRNRWDECLMIS